MLSRCGARIPPALGPDNRAGVTFIYPPEVRSCSFTVSPAVAQHVAAGGEGTVIVVASAPGCTWNPVPGASWVTITTLATGTGSGSFTYRVASNIGGALRTTGISVAGQRVTVSQESDTDNNLDTLPDAWEARFGLDPQSAAGEAGPEGDPDGDGRTNAQELASGTHPRGFFTRYLAEGAVNAFFRTRLALLNPGTTVARMLVRIEPQGAPERSMQLDLPAVRRATLDAPALAALTSEPFATVVESDQLVVVDRTMSWTTPATARTPRRQSSPSSTWYFAEGSTSGDFALFYLLQNANDSAVNATVRFLRPVPLHRSSSRNPATQVAHHDSGGHRRSRACRHGRLGRHHCNPADHRRAGDVLESPRTAVRGWTRKRRRPRARRRMVPRGRGDRVRSSSSFC